jgi:hypothetical protein
MENFLQNLRASPKFLEIVFVFAIVMLILAHKISVEGMIGVE